MIVLVGVVVAAMIIGLGMSLDTQDEVDTQRGLFALLLVLAIVALFFAL